jgi:hypothetical protein
MLIVRDAQLAIFIEERVRHLPAWLLPHLREHFRARLAGSGDEALRSLIEMSVARARALGATRSTTIGKFVHLRVLFGDELETLPWAAQTLNNPRLTGDRRVDVLSRRAREVLGGRGPVS